ncbi:(deoxy)nucleoside triphosphate pyrophosphohydrolase [bacterium]|nr:(deoxy)nucleoside triphosphate pyrophosphohydrolase [bacterium]
MSDKNVKHIEVAAAVIIKDNRVLLTRRKRGEHSEGFWEFPGGKIEKGETPPACLERELFEELGVKSKAHEVIIESKYTYANRSILLIALRAELLDNNISLRVHDKLKWVPAEKLLEYKLSPADIPIAAKILELRNIDTSQTSLKL